MQSLTRETANPFLTENGLRVAIGSSDRKNEIPSQQIFAAHRKCMVMISYSKEKMIKNLLCVEKNTKIQIEILVNSLIWSSHKDPDSLFTPSLWVFFISPTRNRNWKRNKLFSLITGKSLKTEWTSSNFLNFFRWLNSTNVRRLFVTLLECNWILCGNFACEIWPIDRSYCLDRCTVRCDDGSADYDTVRLDWDCVMDFALE